LESKQRRGSILGWTTAIECEQKVCLPASQTEHTSGRRRYIVVSPQPHIEVASCWHESLYSVDSLFYCQKSKLWIYFLMNKFYIAQLLACFQNN